MLRPLVAAALLLTVSAPAAQALPFGPVAADCPAPAMADLAQRVLDQAPTTDPDVRFRLLMAAGRPQEAAAALSALMTARAAADPSPQARATDLPYLILARARARRSADPTAAFAEEFRATFASLDNRTAALVAATIGAVDRGDLQRTFETQLARASQTSDIPLADAISLLRAYQVAEAFAAFTPQVAALVAEDDARRYEVTRDRLVSTRDGAQLCVLVVRPRTTEKRPALLEFTIYAAPEERMMEARRSASNGYIGVAGLSRGKGCSPGAATVWEHDGPDAADLIAWIARQPWSDGRVGMFGGSYNAYTQWAALKQRPPALKAVMPSAPVAPGLDVPMDGGVFLNFMYPFPFYTTRVKGLDTALYASDRWGKLDTAAYAQGSAYRERDTLDGLPNRAFRRWLEHPIYDAYWQAMIPYGAEFAAIDVPVLVTTGYYDGSQLGAVHYFDQHLAHRPDAEHYLVIGPYDHRGAQRGTIGLLGAHRTAVEGLPLDPVARLDVGELRYAWFDYVLRGGPKPALLQDRINYQVVGANTWKHAPTFAAMASAPTRLFLSAADSGPALATTPGRAPIAQRIDFADRSDAERVPIGGLALDAAIDTQNSLVFSGPVLTSPTEFSGLFSAQLDVVANKRDFDFEIRFYEQTAAGQYLQLSSYLSRASMVGDLTRRRLLTPGEPRRLSLRASRLASRQMAVGSRLIMALTVLKQPDRQINYGTGRDVSDETVADAEPPLDLKWLPTSYVDAPLTPPTAAPKAQATGREQALP